jgi:hypothetical protein
MSKTEKTSEPGKGGLVGVIALLFGFLLTLVSLASVLNTAFGWKMKLKGTPLPDDWDATIGLIGVTVVFWAIWAFLSYVPPVRRFGQKHPWWMALFVVAGLVGVIVGITIWDNANRAERHANFQAKMEADSLKRIEESATFFEGNEVPFRLAVFNAEGDPLEFWIDSVNKGTIPPFQMVEFQLPWEAANLIAKREGAEIHRQKIKPDATKGKDAAALHIYMPLGHLLLEVFDYSPAYEGGKLNPAKEIELDLGEFVNFGDYVTLEKSGPFYVFPNQPAPETSKYKVFRLVIIPMEITDHYEKQAFAAWVMRRIDKRGAGQAAETPAEQLAAWKAEQ